MRRIINIREHADWLEKAAGYFSARWDIDRQIYLDSMNDSLREDSTIPRRYIMLRGDDIIV